LGVRQWLAAPDEFGAKLSRLPSQIEVQDHGRKEEDSRDSSADLGCSTPSDHYPSMNYFKSSGKAAT
jgi:hypothetical protein